MLEFRVPLSASTTSRYAELNSTSACQELSRRTLSQVVRWRWATAEKVHLDPYACEKCRLPPGKWLKSEPVQVQYKPVHGFDAAGNIVLIRTGCEIPEVYADECLHYSDELWESALVGNDGLDGVVLKRLMRDGGQPNQLELIGPMAVSSATYEFQGGVLVSEHTLNESLIHSPRRLRESSLSYQYDDRGRLERIQIQVRDRDPDGPWKTWECYRRPRPGETVKALSAEVERALLSSVPEKLRQARIAEPVYCLLLVYDLENEPLPPALALGTESLRQQVRAAHGTEAKYYLWNPADFVHFNRPDLELTDTALSEACARLNDLLTGRGNLAPARRVLNSVAAQLQQRDWTGILHPTDDFVVVAVDLESQDDLHKNIKQSVPAERIRQLRNQGLLV